MQDKQSKTSTPSGFLYIIVGVLLAAVIILLVGFISQYKANQLRQSTTIEGVIKPLREITTVSYIYTDIVEAKQKSVIIENQQLIRYSATITAGYDMSKVEVNSDPATKTITVIFPEMKTSCSEPSDFKHYDLKKGFFNRIDATDSVNEMKADMDAKCKQMLADDTFISTSQEQAKQMISSLLYTVPEAEGYTINYKFK